MEEGIQTGDILYRHSEARGPFGVPFSFLVSKLSRSKYSHASIFFWEGSEAFVVEVDDRGTHKMPFEDWKAVCVDGYYAYCRPKKQVPQEVILKHIYEFLEEDPDYDFTFNEHDKYYCVESVVEIYCRAGLCDLFTPHYIKEVIPWIYPVFWILNSIVGFISGKCMNTNDPLYFVGNENMGMLASKKVTPIVEAKFDQG